MRVTVETQRMVLRPMVPEDYEEAFQWCGDPKVNTYMIYPLYTKAEDVRTWLEGRNLDDPDDYDLGFELKETGELIGSGGLVYDPEKDVWTVGYNIRVDQWGKGLVPEAIQGLIDYVRRVRKVRAIEGVFAAENYQSQRVMEKLGMHYVCDTEYDKLDGSRHYEAKLFRREFT